MTTVHIILFWCGIVEVAAGGESDIVCEEFAV